MNEASRRKYEAELRRLDDEIAALQEHWRHVPRYLWFGLLAPVMWYVHGFSAALVTLLVTAALVGTRAYLIGVRVSENRWTRDSLQRELAQADGEAEQHLPHALGGPVHA